MIKSCKYIQLFIIIYFRGGKMLNLIIKEKSFDKLILEDVNINFKKNKICGLVGLNGSGKTTLLNILLGLYTTINNKR